MGVDIELEGFTLTAEEWSAFDDETRRMLLEDVADGDDAPEVVYEVRR